MGFMKINIYPIHMFPNKNYPVENQPLDKTSENYIRQYLNQNQTTDKFYNDNVGLMNINTADINKEFNTLSGKKIDATEFKHNNMVPFFGSTVKGPQINTSNNTILDNYQGSGSQNIKKVEQAPLFKPADNIQLNNGAPNSSDFYQSRQNPSTKMANVLPWEQQKVAPGLGLGYTTEGAGGFNSGMLDRKAWAPPTVDELRVKTNPKVTYGLFGHEGPAQSEVQNPPIQGTVEKNRPDTAYTVGCDRWLTTTGSSLGPTQIPQQMVTDTDRCSLEYYGSGGNAADSKATYITGHHEPSHRHELCKQNLNPVAAPGQGSSNPNDYGIKGYKIPKNNREVSCQSQNNGVVGGINSTFKAMMAPIVDALRPSKKEDVIHNANLLGNVQALVPNLPLTNPNDQLKTTNKEMTGGKIGLNYLNVSHVAVPEGGYQATEMQVKEQQRNSCNSSSLGFMGNTALCSAPMDESAWNNQHNNVNKTYENWPMAGNTSVFNGHINVESSKKDDRMNSMRCQDTMLPAPQRDATIPSLETYGKIHMPQQYNQEVNCNRMNPDILSAFKSNPYAQSLNSY